MPSFSKVEVGQAVEYFSASSNQWRETTIMAVEEDGFRVTIKKGRLFPFEDPEGVRLVEPQERARGTADPTWTRWAEEALKENGGLGGIFTKFHNTYSTPDGRAALAMMLRETFSAEGSATEQSFQKMPGNGSIKGLLHPSMLSFDPASWDLFYVYEADFKREVTAIAHDGLPQPSFQVQPVDGAISPGAGLGAFAWKPDGPYRVFVGIAAVMFMSIVSVEKKIRNPPWMVADFSQFAGVYLFQGSAVARGLSSLKSTILAAKQNRMADPLMIDHMLQSLYPPPPLAALSAGGSDSLALSAGGSGRGTSGPVDLASAGRFIDRYNASVNYDPSLMLKDKAAMRQSNLLDPAKCSVEMKALMRSSVEAASSFEDAGLSLEILATGEFWIGFVFVSSSHPQWVVLGRTTKWSCLASLEALFAAKQKKMPAPAFQLLARRLAFTTNVIQGTFGRRSVSRGICNTMLQRVLDGLYDDDIDNLLDDCDEEAPKNDDLAMDTHLAEVSAFVQDALELQDAEKSANPEEQARVEAATSMGEAEWFMAEVEHDLSTFLKGRSAKDKLVESLRTKEAEWQKRVDDNVKEATASFAEKHVPIVRYEADAFRKLVQVRREQIAKERRCEVKKVLAVLWLDLPRA